VNLATREVILESHPASEYNRIELVAGFEVPNFQFKDLNGNTHQLSDYRGKYVLLDFWGTW
jgi:thiol-disulfide isomerase/thioredoxin